MITLEGGVKSLTLNRRGAGQFKGQWPINILNTTHSLALRNYLLASPPPAVTGPITWLCINSEGPVWGVQLAMRYCNQSQQGAGIRSRKDPSSPWGASHEEHRKSLNNHHRCRFLSLPVPLKFTSETSCSLGRLSTILSNLYQTRQYKYICIKTTLQTYKAPYLAKATSQLWRTE